MFCKPFFRALYVFGMKMFLMNASQFSREIKHEKYLSQKHLPARYATEFVLAATNREF